MLRQVLNGLAGFRTNQAIGVHCRLYQELLNDFTDVKENLTPTPPGAERLCMQSMSVTELFSP